MSKLEELTAVWEKTKLKSREAQDRITEGYKKLIYKILEQENYNLDLIKGFYSDLAKRSLSDREWSDRDRLCIDIEKNRSYRVDVEIKKSSVEFNNCCSGTWNKESTYYEYIKMHVILADHSEEILIYANSIDRSDILAAYDAGCAVRNEEERLKQGEEANRLKAREEELNSSDYIAVYSKWNPDEFEKLYKIIKITEKQIKVEVYSYTAVNASWTKDPYKRNRNLDKKGIIFWDQFKFIKQADVDAMNKYLKEF